MAVKYFATTPSETNLLGRRPETTRSDQAGESSGSAFSRTQSGLRETAGNVRAAIRNGTINIDDPAVTQTLLKLGAVVGVTGFFDKSGALNSMGIQCALCHSTVDGSLAQGIGRRRDGWPNRD